MCNSSAFQCLNLTQKHCTTVALTVGITDLVLSIVTTSLLLCLLLVLKRKAWNSPVKRLTLIIIACTGLSESVFASVELYNNVISITWNKVFNLVISYTVFVTLPYLIVILAILLFKIGATIVPGKWKHKQKPRLRLLLEVMVHILIPVLPLSFLAVATFYPNGNDFNCEPQKIFSSVKFTFYVITVLLILGCFVMVALLLYFYGRFWTTQCRGITRRAKWLLLQFSVLLALLLTESILEALFTLIHNAYTIIVLDELVFIVKLVISLALVAVVYLPDIHCHKYCKEAPDQRSLLINSDTQPTNPSSVWDHANDPSYTVYKPPPEMSDCVTDATRTL